MYKGVKYEVDGSVRRVLGCQGPGFTEVVTNAQNFLLWRKN